MIGIKIYKNDIKNKIFIVAEVGNNHEGNISNAYKLIEKAKDSGVDAVKFQTYNVKKYYSTSSDIKRIKKLEKFQLSHQSLIKLSKYAKKLGLIFFSTPFDLDSAIFLNKLQNIFKISSGDNDFYNLIEKVLTFKKPIIISTGMLSYKEIKKLYNFINNNKFKNQICFLHCVSSYPAQLRVKFKFNNLFKRKFRLYNSIFRPFRLNRVLCFGCSFRCRGH